MNAKEYRQERDEAQASVAFLVGEIAVLNGLLQESYEKNVALEQDRDSQKERAHKFDIALRDTTESLNQREQEIDFWKRNHDVACNDRDHWKREANNPYYQNLARECEDLRTINATNRGPIWTKRLHDLLRGPYFSKFDQLERTIDAQEKQIEQQSRTVDNVTRDRGAGWVTIRDLTATAEDLRDQLKRTKQDRQAAWDVRAQAYNELATAKTQVNTLQNRLQCQIHNRRQREAHIDTLKSERGRLCGALIEALNSRDRYKRLYFENVSDGWEA
jgi:chromosome segregation ATPase